MKDIIKRIFGENIAVSFNIDDEIAFYSKFLNKGDLCYDIGANIGNKTEIFLNLGCKVIAVEPQKKCFRKLVKRFSKNTNVTLVNKALGSNNGITEINICEKSPTISTMSNKWITEGRFSKDFKWKKKESIKITTLDDLINIYGIPKYCKVDVEGYEIEVLKGLTKIIPLISFEYTNEFFEDSVECISILEKLGYTKFNYTVGEILSFANNSFIDKETIIEGIKSIKNTDLWGDIYASL